MYEARHFIFQVTSCKQNCYITSCEYGGKQISIGERFNLLREGKTSALIWFYWINENKDGYRFLPYIPCLFPYHSSRVLLILRINAFCISSNKSMKIIYFDLFFRNTSAIEDTTLQCPLWIGNTFNLLLLVIRSDDVYCYVHCNVLYELETRSICYYLLFQVMTFIGLLVLNYKLVLKNCHSLDLL